ncbi:pseudouridine synthase [Planktosalinus lacus]|uniref:Pseudouridine synthase n=2 Tax=Planktosalinus lacus TaxID=1526573 RepID=A0A8J2YBC3_9FLAO|nr:pseudouridine synthase [Planktosalinus lacus]
MLSQFVYNQNTRKNKRLLTELGAFPEGTMSIGRLDEDSEGLLLLTTCGKTSAAVRSKEIEKEYYVQVDGLITPAAIAALQQGVEISIQGSSYTTLAAQVYIPKKVPQFPERAKKVRDDRHGPSSWVSITITEGKFRQVRKMTAAVGFPTLRLVRVRIGNERLEGLPSEGVQEVENFNVATL